MSDTHDTYKPDNHTDYDALTTRVVDALLEAYDAMDQGAVASIRYTLATVDTRNGTHIKEFEIEDLGHAIESGILTVHTANTHIRYITSDGPSIMLTWDCTRHLDGSVELIVYADYRASRFTFADTLLAITIDDGIDESDLLDWYNDRCMSQIFDDITDTESDDVEGA